ncbi:uncharacterized protein LOC127279584 isoform X2 [Leptopilina boulardi]|uniref:uncharacterized protein LOC127279584 isoform X2 n=1 Tax=Leptopilina boulardi TaxID=63433 RepID=UPI0021F540A5|nr:uncharacterized protein LOC127279584 isoform X2 [Leptopilina boulardi]
MSVIAVITDQKGRPVCSNGKYYCQVNLGDGNIINKFIDKSFLVTEGEGKEKEVLWTDDTIKLLIESYREKSQTKTFNKLLRKQIWQKISENLQERGYVVTGSQCTNKWKGLMKQYKKKSLQ